MTGHQWAFACCWQPLPGASVLHLDGPLHAAEGARLRSDIQALLRRGRRSIVLSMASVPAIDAAGIGELVRAYNMTIAAAGALQITESSQHVRELLDRVGLFPILSAGASDLRASTNRPSGRCAAGTSPC